MIRPGVVLAALLLLGGCAAQRPIGTDPSEARKPDAALTNTRWKLIMLGGETVPPLDRETWILFEEGSQAFRGFAGCNRISGTYTIEDGLLTVGVIVSTQKDCPEMEIGSGLLRALEGTTSYSITADTLVLTSDGVDAAFFEAVYLP